MPPRLKRYLPAVKSYLKRFFIVALFAALLGLGILFRNAAEQNNALRKSMSEQSKAMERTAAQLGEANKKVAQLQAHIATNGKQCTAEAEQMKSAIEAFAKQANACEALRQKLNVKGYTSWAS